MIKRIIVTVTALLIIIFAAMFIYRVYKRMDTFGETNSNSEIKDSVKRYLEIRENVRKAVEKNISAQYPSCPITYEYDRTFMNESFYNSSFLVNNGYIAKSDLLDVDDSSYCDVYVEILAHYDNLLDRQNNCKTAYKIYLKCKNYEDDGYVNWG